MGNLKEKLSLLPESPGVYIMLDKDGIVIYVGKARVLKNRVRQYFHASVKPEKVAAMVENIADFYDAVFFKNMLNQILTKSPLLCQFSGAAQNERVKKFSEFDVKYMCLSIIFQES